jgi:sec-independent protein translocase protein TatC
MSITGAFGLVLIIILAVSVIGPRKLPSGLEQLLLLLTNLRLSNSELPPLTLEQARRSWQSNGSILYAVIQILYGAEEHLLEIRRRIFYVLLSLVVGAVLAGVFLNPLLEILKKPAGNVPFQFLHPTDMIWVYMEIVFSAAAVIALPVLLIQVLKFIRPALETPAEIKTYRAFSRFGFPLVLIFFALGATFAYFLLLPFGLRFLSATGGDLASANWNVREYFSFVLAVILWIGLAFETPLVMGLLGLLGVVSPAAMLRQWRFAVVGIAVVAAVITPTVDPVNMGLVMGPLLALYFLGVLLAKILYKPRPAADAQAAPSGS